MATLNIRKDKDGKDVFQVIIRMKGYPTQCATFKSKTKAKIWIQQTEAAMREGRHFKTIEARKHTLADLIDRYIKNDLPQRKSYHQNFEMQISWWKNKIGAYLLSDIAPALLSEYKEKLQKEIYKVKELEDGTKVEKHRSNATVNRYMAAISIVLTKAVREYGWIEENPMLKVTKKTESRGRERYLSEEEHAALLKACSEASNPLINLLVVIALSTGARFSEIVNLKWENVNLKDKVFYFMNTKNGDNRAIPISSTAYNLLQKHSKVRKINSGYVFARPDGKKPLHLRHQWDEAIKRAGLEGFRFHDLRHTAASYLAMNGATLVEISEILGHKTMQMVKRYSHLTTKHTAAILERLDEQQFKTVAESVL